MDKPDFHILVCASFRLNGEQKGVCHRKGATDLLQYLENEVSDRGMNAVVSSTGCFKVCERGPAMIVYPGGHWYGPMNEEAIDQVLDALEEGTIAQHLVMT